MTTEHMSIDTNETFAVENFANDSYLNYSMYVIMDRALPHIGDGLKPVHRRLVYAMNGLKLNFNAKYKKSARTVGDTLGKYHPHGDTSCYEAMVLMAQPFSTRTPLVDGQGNWGSQDDPKSFAAMRYTEAKLTEYAGTMLGEIDQDTVDWKPNFDGTMKEPVVLPAQLPNILINGSIGIAVGMSTEIPPHNPEEVTKACILAMQKKSTTDDEILDIVTGPDYPTGGTIVTPTSDIREIYKKGKGTVTLRADYEVSDSTITITSLPFQVQLSKVLIAIADQVENKKLPMITSIDDTSDEQSPVQIVIGIKNNKVDADAIMQHLFATTDLEKTQKVNLNMIGLDNKPKTKPLPSIIREWCTFRQDVFERKKLFRLKKIMARLHIVDGLLIAYNNLDEVIRIIREEDEPKQELMDKFSLTEIQANAILDLKLRHLAKLEEQQLIDEAKALQQERDEIQALLADDGKIKRAIIAELKAVLKKHVSERRTQFGVALPAKAISNTQLVPPSNTTVILSKNNWIRSAKGHDVDPLALNYKAGDKYAQHLETRTNQNTLIMSYLGRFFSIDTATLPNAKTVGEPLSTRMTMEGEDKVHSMLAYDETKTALITTNKGNGFLVPMTSMDTRAKKGKHIISVTKGVKPLVPHILDGEDSVVLLTKAGRMSIVPIDEINISNKSQGIRLIHVKDDEFSNLEDEMVASLPIKKGDSFTLTVGKRDYKITPEKYERYLSKRARRGLLIEQMPKTQLPMKLSK